MHLVLCLLESAVDGEVVRSRADKRRPEPGATLLALADVLLGGGHGCIVPRAVHSRVGGLLTWTALGGSPLTREVKVRRPLFLTTLAHPLVLVVVHSLPVATLQLFARQVSGTVSHAINVSLR